MPKMKRRIDETPMQRDIRCGYAVSDMAHMLELDRPRLFARNRHLIIGAIVAYALGCAAIAYGIYRIAEAVL